MEGIRRRPTGVDEGSPSSRRGALGGPIGTSEWRPSLGANLVPGGAWFRVWAPAIDHAEVVLYTEGGERSHPLRAERGGYHAGFVKGVQAGTRYKIELGDRLYPDPAARSLPDGVHGAGEVVDPESFAWSDEGWQGLSAQDLVIYELHVGAFTDAGTFDAAIAKLDDLAALGVTAVEVMPIASFAGSRNWGYDGVALYAPSRTYGDPEAFKRFVDAAHARGLGVILDVVYNHFGPDGNYLGAMTGGRFFTDRHTTPWGPAIDFDGPNSPAVRDFILQNALYWAVEYHVDGLRLDAIHAIRDDSPVHIVKAIAGALHALRPRRLVIAEDERNERALVLPEERGGFGLDAVWADDLHHHVRRMVAGDCEGYFESFSGRLDDVAHTLRKGWFYEGQPLPRTGRPRGSAAQGLPPHAFVHCIQNHDQVGNRATGDRLGHSVDPAIYRTLTALLLVSPYIPLLWMGQEWNASTPFLYFTDHETELGRRVTEGRREEFKGFSAFSDPVARARIPDPQAESTFLRSKLDWEERGRPPHRGILELHRALLALRHREPALRNGEEQTFRVEALGDHLLALRRAASERTVLLLASFRPGLRLDFGASGITRPPAGSHWAPALSTDAERFGGDGTLDLTEDGVRLEEPGAVVLWARGS